MNNINVRINVLNVCACVQRLIVLGILFEESSEIFEMYSIELIRCYSLIFFFYRCVLFI